MRFLMTGAALLALGACGPSIPESGVDSGAGVGFGNYEQYKADQAARNAQLAGRSTADASSDDAAGLAAQTRIALGTDPEELAANSGQPIIQAGPDNPPPPLTSNPGISVENSFDAVKERRSIDADAARIQALRQNYEVAPVQALPSRSGGEGPNIVAYALSTRQSPGTPVYRRGGIGNEARHARNCAAYPSPDMAQLDFLQKGGPERDRLDLDPDGDGFACGWDPRPFRKAARG